MSLRTKGLVLAMEDDLEIESTSGETDEAMVEVAENMSEVEDSAAEVEEMNDAIDSTITDGETLEKIQGVMEESVESGEGLDETSAEIAEIAIESICARLGIEQRVMPAMESFGSSNSRVVATKIALETISEVAERVWKAVKEAFKKVWDYIVEFYKKYATGLGIAKRANDQLMKDAKSFGKTKKEKESIDNKSLATSLVIGGDANFDTAKTILSNHVNLADKASNGITILEGVAKLLYGGIEKADAAKMQEASDKFSSTVIDGTESLIGQTSLEKKAEQAVEGVRGFVARIVMKSTDVQKETLPVLDKKQMIAITTEVDSLLKATTKFVDNKNKIDSTIKNFFKGIDLLLKSLEDLAKDGENDSTIKEKTGMVKESVNNARSAISALSTAIPSLNLRAAKAGMSYVSASMKAYS